MATLSREPSADRSASTATSSSNPIVYALQLIWLFFEQVLLMCQKHVSQKQRKGRQFWKDSVMIQFFTLAFIAYIMYNSSQQYPATDVYSKFELPPLSDQQPYGIFNKNSEGNTQYTIISKRLYYAPANHQGIQDLVAALLKKYPDVKAFGATDYNDVVSQYQENLFDTWAAMVFDLNTDQINTNELITSQTVPSQVKYTIYVNPTNWGNTLPTYNFSDTSSVFNKQSSAADLFWSTGYMTLQNFVGTYLSQQYDNVPADFNVETFIQRYPSSPIYDDQFSVNIDTARNFIWKWIGATLLSICLFVPILSLLTEIVRERQYLMKDLLDISGLMNISYWFSYLVMILFLGQVSMWFSLGLLNGFNILDNVRILPYASLLTCYILGSGTFGMLFGFLVDRSEYYGLPIFLLTVALTVCGAYLGVAYDITASLKLFFCFLSPSIGLTMGVIAIESYLYHHQGEDMDYFYYNDNKNYPSLQGINGVIIASAIMYFGIILLMPLDWLFRLTTSNAMDMFIANRNDDIKYPCDTEEEAANSALSKNPCMLNVENLSQVYPDGTHAVKDMNFRIRQGEVLSFLGANGAGKSTTMKMLCGTLDATYGDAQVNGYSIMAQRTLARRNLGIAMQQDVIWDDVNVEDHLMLFGRLRGLHGKPLRDAVSSMAESLGFPEKRKFLAGTLSGGQKRRLCVGLSMVGGNGVVYLDEPTAGLDPVSRRQLWDLVQRNREGRAILLTTHFMDEADVLGDRIAIVKEGRLRAIGTSKFLKTRFGLGYLLRMSLQANANVDNILNCITEQISSARMSSSAGTELSVRLSRDVVSMFPKLLEHLESQSLSLGILSYGIETTTLEEVFMRIVNEDTEQLVMNHNEANDLLAASPEEHAKNQALLNARDEERHPLTKDYLASLLIEGNIASSLSLFTQVPVMMQKRFYQFSRSRGQWSMNVFIPLSIAILGSILISSMPTSLLSTSIDIPSYATVSNQFPTLVAGNSETATMNNVQDAFQNSINAVYVGQNYSTLFNDIDSVASVGYGPTSLDGILYDSKRNFTVIYNASYPMNFAGLVQESLQSAVVNVTKNLLQLDQSYGQLPSNKLNSQLNTGFFFAMLVSLIAGSFGAGMSIVISGERVTQVKHQQLASGASSAAYWLGNFFFDVTLILTYIFLFTAILAVFNPTTYGGSNYGEIVLAGVFFTVASIFRFYSLSYFIADVRLAQSIYFYGSIAIVFVLIDVWFNVLFVSAKGNVTNASVQVVSYIFALLDPTFGLYIVILYQNNFLGILTQNPSRAFYSNEVAGTLLSCMIGSALIYAFLFIFVTENAFGYLLQLALGPVLQMTKNGRMRVKPIMSLAEEEEYNELANQPSMTVSMQSNGRPSLGDKQRSVTLQDPDVVTETKHVQAIAQRGVLNPKLSTIFLADLRKVYFARGNIPSKIAVKGAHLSIGKGEVFGLLGANGAGKTTLLKMLCGQEDPSGGCAYINGYDVVQNRTYAQRSMGLCPQFDTLLDRLTVEENLLFFGRLKGVPMSELSTVVKAYMYALNIDRYAFKLIQQLSGGNRRKVSLAVALMGAPPAVYLDEPSTGLDPVASRLMWRLLARIAQTKKTALVLTTHSMLECESVCTRVGIMKNGEMVCLGDSQHLRTTHGTGFQLEVHLQPSIASTAAELVSSFVQKHFVNAVLIEEHPTLLNYEIPKESIGKLSQCFQMLEDHKQQLGIEDYVLSQSTLEQVFLKQIRPNLKDSQAQEEQTDMNNRVPLFKDYLTVYIVWLLALFIPGLHHFYLGNTLRGFKYFFTFNEVLAGWILDLFELHVLLQKSVQEHGHVAGPLYCSCCAIWCYCMTCCHCCGLCFRPKPANNEQNTRATEEMDVVVTAQPLDAV